ncbi:MAG: type II secretion system protein N [Litorimonas sp.]
MRLLLIVVAVVAGVLSLVRHFPLSWAGAALPDGVATLSGTLWDGQVSDVPLLGSVSVDTTLGGVRLATPPGDVTFSGTVTPGSAKDLVLSMPVARLPMNDARLAELSGRVSLRIEEASFGDGQCESATGTASSDVLSANGGRFGWTGPVLSGPVDCQDGRLRVRLSGEDAEQTVQATVITGFDGVYQSEIDVETSDPSAGNALVLFGFNPDSEGYSLSEQGRWR